MCKSLYLEVELNLFIQQQRYLQEAVTVWTLEPDGKSEDLQMSSALTQPIRTDPALGFTPRSWAPGGREEGAERAREPAKKELGQSRSLPQVCDYSVL